MLKQVRQLFAIADQELAPKPSPIVSIVVIVYDMADQAKNTLRSLLPDYQHGVGAEQYEVLVVENTSPRLIDRDFINGLPGNFRYFLREAGEVSPVNAINFGASKAVGDHICLMIDGARMLTPGVVQNLVLGHRLHDSAIVTVPGYHLGNEFQQEAVKNGYGVEKERMLIRSINWPEDGYRLFDIACFGASSAPGFFLPNSESNCISIPRAIWEELGGCDEGFDLRGGGLTNLDLYKRACEFPGAQHVIVPGEGTFHQYHGGVTTGGEKAAVTKEYMNSSYEQYRQLRGQDYESPVTNAIFLGQVPVQAQKFLLYSAEKRRAQPQECEDISQG